MCLSTTISMVPSLLYPRAAFSFVTPHHFVLSLSSLSPWLAHFLIQELSGAPQYPPKCIQNPIAEFKAFHFLGQSILTACFPHTSCATSSSCLNVLSVPKQVLGPLPSCSGRPVLLSFPHLQACPSVLPPPLPAQTSVHGGGVGSSSLQARLAFLDLQASHTLGLVLEVRLHWLSERQCILGSYSVFHL